MCLTFFSPSFFFFFLPEREKERDLKRGDDEYKWSNKWSDRSSANEWREPKHRSLLWSRSSLFLSASFFSLWIFFCISLARARALDVRQWWWQYVKWWRDYKANSASPNSEPTEHRQKERHERRRSCGELRAIFFFCISLVYFFSLSPSRKTEEHAQKDTERRRRRRRRRVSLSSGDDVIAVLQFIL